MRVSVKVIPNAKKAGVASEGETLKVKLISPPSDGKANKELLEILSAHYSVPKSRIKIVRGEKSRNKILEIEK